nr:MAG TPA: HTH-type transcriptional regulator [Caudoviricetes sp.]
MELKDRVKQLADRKKISLPQLEQELGYVDFWRCNGT